MKNGKSKQALKVDFNVFHELIFTTQAFSEFVQGGLHKPTILLWDVRGNIFGMLLLIPASAAPF